MKKHIHLIGIGGSGLSAIALVLLGRGYTVSGSDRTTSVLTEKISAAGGKVYTGHRVENISGAEIVVRSSAIADENVEVKAALQVGIPVLKRLEFLSFLTEGFLVIAVAGTHGKTTTTAMITWILSSAGLDPSFIIGGISNNLATNASAGQGIYFVIEADEYDRMFLGLTPWIAVVTNVEHDHPDCYPTSDDFRNAFLEFTQRVSDQGALVMCGDDSGVAWLGEQLFSDTPVYLYGIDNPNNHYTALDLDLNSKGGYSFTAIRTQDKVSLPNPEPAIKRIRIELSVPGIHNVLNALAALSVSDQIGLSLECVSQALGQFTGVGRRFEIRGEFGGIVIIDDYAHHPTEIRATLEAARNRFGRRKLWVVWQPHTFSRTRLLANEFALAFGDAHSNLADQLLVTGIYAAREPLPQDGFSAEEIAKKIQHLNVKYLPELQQVSRYLLDNLVTGDVLLVLSAGDGDLVSAQVIGGLKVRASQDIKFANG